MRTLVVATVVVSLVSSASLATDVLNMGGTRNPTTGQWTGNASLEFVTVGDAGNAADTTGYGAVGYAYQMGKYDVTAAQYCAFLNAVASTGDPYGLYYPSMAPAYNPPSGFGITRSGGSGSYTYSVTGNPNFPMNLITWGDAARFCNWLANGQPTTGVEGAGTTETGSYTLNGATSNAALMNITRNANATYVIPTEDEWYKAAYYKGGSANAGYWLYPTQSNNAPSNVLSATGRNNANCAIGIWNGKSYTYTYTDPTNLLTAVGAFASSPGSYGTFDMGGDIRQWNEANISSSFQGRGLRGGAFSIDISNLLSSSRGYASPGIESDDIGFRVCLVPEPATLSLLALGGLLIARRRRG